MAPKPWTQLIHFHWPHSLGYLENRIALVRALKANERYTAYKVGDREVRVRFDGWSYQLSVDAISVTLAMATIDVDRKLCTEMMQTVIDKVEPAQLTSAMVLFQHLSPLQGDAETLQRRGASSLLSAVLPSLEPQDYAVVADASADNGCKLRVEFGIVSADELPDRLAGSLGTMRRRDDDMADYWGEQDLPTAAAYIGSDWQWPDIEVDEELTERINGYWDTALMRANEIAAPIAARLAGDSSEILSDDDDHTSDS